jgi:hypothetical protein
VDELLSCDGTPTQHIGQWYREHHHQHRWYLDCRTRTIWQCDGGKWFQHIPITFGRLRFEPVGQEAERHAGTQLSYVAEISRQRRYITITDKINIIDITPASITPIVQYQSLLGECFFALPMHVQRLVGNIPPQQLPTTWDATKPVDIIVATYVSVLFGDGYHSWILALDNEEIITSGGGPDDGTSAYMTSYRSELGGIISGLAVIGMLHRSGLVCLHHIKFVCDNSAVIIASKITVTQSIFHRLESDYDMISTMKFLQGNWCKDYAITYEWVNGHADRGNEEPNKEEQLNIEADALCDIIRNEETGPLVARCNCALRESEVCTFFIMGTTITSKMKGQLQIQVHDKSMRKYLTQREIWTDRQFKGIDWTSYGIAFRHMGRSRQTTIAKAWHNL